MVAIKWKKYPNDQDAGLEVLSRCIGNIIQIRCKAYPAPIADEAAVIAMVKTIESDFGHIDILINSAAIFPEKDTFTGTHPVLWDQIMNINLRAPFLLSQAFAAQLPAETPGKIINILDARLRHPATDHFVYRFAKGSLAQMTEMLALELAPHITVNGVALGAILPPPGKDASHLDAIAQKRVPLRRAGSAEIVAENVLHLLRQDFLTGVIIPIDGGEFLR